MPSHLLRNSPHVASFCSLPSELRERIIQEAVRIDRSTAWPLALVSRDVHALVLPEMYRSVKVTRPSALAELVATIVARPELGRLNENLFVGPDELLPPDWWPLVYPEDERQPWGPEQVRLSLDSHQAWPRWYTTGQQSQLAGNAIAIPSRGRAVLSAIQSAQDHLYVDLQNPRRAPDGKVIGSTSWTVGVMELQAALDLYVLELCRLEDMASATGMQSEGPPSGHGPPCVDYPSLVLTTTSSPGRTSSSTSIELCEDASDSAKPTFVLHRSTLLDHLYRRGGKADRFDHPLIFASAGININIFTRRDRSRLNDTLEAEAQSLYENDQSASNAFNTINASGALTQPSPLDPARYATATFDGILALMRRLLDSTPHLCKLFLSGFLQRTLCGDQAAPVPPSLRLLCFGPLGIHTDDSLSPRICEGQLAQLEQLRIRGSLLNFFKQACIAALPRLKRVHWDLHHSGSWKSVEIVRDVRRHARSSDLANKMDEDAQQQKRSNDSFDDDGGALVEESAEAAASAPLLVQFGLSTECKGSLQPRLRADALEAWHQDEPYSEGAYRFQLWTSKQNRVPFEERADLASEGVARAYQDINAEWEECIE